MTQTKDLLREVSCKNTAYKFVYEFFANEHFDAFFSKKGHEISYAGKYKESLRFEGKDPLTTIRRVFNIQLPAKSCPEKNFSLFKSRFLQAAYGNGQELAEITQLNSSSLVALMCFYPLNDRNPLIVSFKSGGLSHTCRFTDLIIEKENPVYAANRPSSIDIALFGTETATNESVVLFLESKFGEYFNVESKSFGISYSKYVARIAQLKKNMDLLPGIELEVTKNACIISGDEHYCEGIKQMIAHYIGASNSFELNKEHRKVYLGTILFDFSELVPESSSALNDYKNCYQGIAKILNNVSDEDNAGIRIVDQALTYQTLFKNSGNEFRMDEDVAEFYRLDK